MMINFLKCTQAFQKGHPRSICYNDPMLLLERESYSYDAEECGCVMCGVTNLWLVNELEEDDYEIQTNHGGIYVEKSKEVFLDDVMTIDFNRASHCFQLKSPNQYLNPRMSLLDKTSKI